MAYQRRRYGNSRMRFRRRRSRLHTPGTKRWEASDFYVFTSMSLPDVNNETNMSYQHLASLSISLAGPAGSPNNVGVALSGMARKLLIGGIVCDFGFELLGPVLPSTESEPVQSLLGLQQGLITDRLYVTGSSVIPSVATSWDPWKTMFPTATINGAGTAPVFDVQEAIGPTHRHFKKTEHCELGPRTLPVSEDLQLIGSQYVRQRSGTLNKKLNLVLDDDHGLFWYFSHHAGSAWNLSDIDYRGCFSWCIGTLYWRTVF